MAGTDVGNHIFSINPDRFHCIHIDTLKHLNDTDTVKDFKCKLKASIKAWIDGGNLRGIWVKIAELHSHLVSACLEVGLELHHAQKGYIMLRKWLSKEPEIWPNYASQYLGCGGFVVNDKEQVLVIEEKWAPKRHWKMPGGHAEPGEDIADAARREVLEETGIHTKFQGIICFRHQHNYQFGCSDFYFVCLMKPLSQEISICQSEIARCTWMDVKEYASHPDISDVNRYIANCYLQTVASGGQFIMGHPVLSHKKDCYNQVYSVPHTS